MRLHHLTATAFGPFAGTIDLDLEELGTRGLYLVHGPTGSGKTSLLDAICFALYANVPGDRRSTTLRSQHADASEPTRVVLELTLGGRRLRIARSPAYERAKKRGTGTTTEPARVQLDEYVAGSWQSLSSRIDEAARVLDDLLGMGLDQFRRVVMLPQGDFAAFLRATDEERREVLERLFDVTDYVAVEEHLTAQRQAAQSILAAARAALEGHTGRLTELLAETEAGFTGLRDLDAPLDHLGPEDLLPAVSAIDAALDAHAGEVMTLVDDAQQRMHTTRAALDAGRRGEDLRSRGGRARSVLEVLADESAEHTDRCRRLDRAREAAAVMPHVDAVRRASSACDAAEVAHDAARAACPFGTEEDLPRVHDRLVEHDDTLARARHEAEVLARLGRGLPRAVTAVEAAEEAMSVATRALAAARSRAAEVDEARVRVDEAATRLEHLTPLVARLTELTRTRSALATLEDASRHATDRRQAAHETVLERRERVQLLVQERLDSMAGELAAQLVDGEACAVCGSPDHPAPAAAGHLVTAEQIDAGREDVTAAETALEQARSADEAAWTELARARARVADLVDQVAELVADDDRSRVDPTGDVGARTEALERERAALGEVVARRAAVEAAVESAAEAVDRAEATLADTTRTHTEARTRHAHLHDETTECVRRLAGALTEHAGGCPCTEPETPHTTAADTPAIDDDGVPLAHAQQLIARVATAAREHRAALAGAEALIDVTAALERARITRVEAEELLATALDDSGFDDRDAVTDAALSRDDLAELERLVADHDAKRTAAEAVLQEEDVVAALADESADIEALGIAAEEARRSADSWARRQASMETVRGQFVTVRDHVRRACAELGPAAERAALVTRMAALVTGTSSDNDKRMRLSTFVLAARLERIVELANERLVDMADGRYELGHDDAGARGQRRGGLGLVVRDLWTGRVRPTSSLSGGESFTASLALALGLADAIREESGGQEFGTLFVDEGFGSLDQDSLEQVLDVLDGLRDGGRTVGVVSHVAEMRTRIPTQVRVHKTQQGSTVSVVGTTTSDVA